MKEVGRMKTKELNKGEIIITSQDLHKPIYEFFKRILDVICSVVALIVLSPAFLVTALAVRSDGGPAFYKSRQEWGRIILILRCINSAVCVKMQRICKMI